MTFIDAPHGEMDFETYSEAGFVWDETTCRWTAPVGAQHKDRGLSTVGTARYSQHPSTEVLVFRYRFPGSDVKHYWHPGLPNPQDLFDYLAAGGVMECHKSFFEYCIWNFCCTRRYGWPPLALYQLRCSMAKARVNALPGALGNLSDVLNLPTPKDKRGKAALDKLSVPQTPTKKQPLLRVTRADDPETFAILDEYCGTDLDAEHGASERMVPMTYDELMFWFIDQEINLRGVEIDRAAVRDCIAVLQQILDVYGAEYREITGGLNITQLEATKDWLSAHGVTMASMDADAIDDALHGTWLPAHGPNGFYAPRRVLELRELTGSAAVKKLFAMENQACDDNRLRDLIIHHGTRTGRPTGDGPQPLNLPRGGPTLRYCASCQKASGVKHDRICPWCGAVGSMSEKQKWPGVPKDRPANAPHGIESLIEGMATRSKDIVEYLFGDAMTAIIGCIRGLFVAKNGYDLICSDYSAIEAVVLACLAGEQWRIDAFRENKPIYLLGASKITGTPLETYLAYFEEHGEHHSDRQKIGKVSELALGFGGWIGSMRAFGADEPDDVLRGRIIAWRDASPAIVEFWGGQKRGLPWEDSCRPELYGVEGHAVAALLNPGQVFDFRGIQFYVRPNPGLDQGTSLIVRLLSGRELTYRNARLFPATGKWAKSWEYKIVYETWNSNPKYGPMGWVPMETYGGRLTENIVQATSHCLLRHAIVNLRAAGYPTVLHVYDECVCEIPKGTGSLVEFEKIMATVPTWAVGWPVRATGGWRGYRYRKA